MKMDDGEGSIRRNPVKTELRLDPVGQDHRGDRRPEGARRVSLLDSLPDVQRQRGLREDKEPREVVRERPEILP